MNNGAVHCGSRICRSVTKTFDGETVPNGYTHIATLPVGASNISITEMKSSSNLLGIFYDIRPILLIIF